jgi:hypothetical protein
MKILVTLKVSRAREEPVAGSRFLREAGTAIREKFGHGGPQH